MIKMYVMSQTLTIYNSMLGEQYAAANLAGSFELVVDFKPLKLYSRI